MPIITAILQPPVFVTGGHPLFLLNTTKPLHNIIFNKFIHGSGNVAYAGNISGKSIQGASGSVKVASEASLDAGGTVATAGEVKNVGEAMEVVHNTTPDVITIKRAETQVDPAGVKLKDDDNEDSRFNESISDDAALPERMKVDQYKLNPYLVSNALCVYMFMFQFSLTHLSHRRTGGQGMPLSKQLKVPTTKLTIP
jgi:hypothetical protein